MNSVGEGRFECKLMNGSLVIGKLAGRLIKGPHKQRIVKNDFVLLQLDGSSSKEKYFIVHKYNNDDKRKLERNGEIVSVKETKDESKTGVVFQDDVKPVEEDVNEHDIDNDFIDDI